MEELKAELSTFFKANQCRLHAGQESVLSVDEKGVRLYFCCDEQKDKVSLKAQKIIEPYIKEIAGQKWNCKL